MKNIYDVNYMIISCCGVLFATTILSHKKVYNLKTFVLQSVSIQILICRNGLGHYHLIASLCDLKVRMSVRCPTIHCPSIVGMSSVLVLSVSPPNFFARSITQYLGMLHVVQCLCCLTPKSCNATTALQVTYSAS